MSQKYIGETLDIHGGGLENAFPHHEDEIAQAEALSGKPFVKYWLHNNMVTVDGQKMGKSLGNFLTLRDAFAKWPPMVIRLFILQTHYRSPTDFSEEAIDAARTGYERLAHAVRTFHERADTAADGPPSAEVTAAADEARRRFRDAMDDDFNTPVALSALFDLVREANRAAASADATRGSMEALAGVFEELGGDVLGLTFAQAAGGELMDRMGGVVQMLIDLRAEARRRKDFDEADRIRDRLAECGVVLEDRPDDTLWRLG
jgi:cysteinyl-tRNA synthetase